MRDRDNKNSGAQDAILSFGEGAYYIRLQLFKHLIVLIFTLFIWAFFLLPFGISIFFHPLFEGYTSEKTRFIEILIYCMAPLSTIIMPLPTLWLFGIINPAYVKGKWGFALDYLWDVVYKNLIWLGFPLIIFVLVTIELLGMLIRDRYYMYMDDVSKMVAFVLFLPVIFYIYSRFAKKSNARFKKIRGTNKNYQYWMVKNGTIIRPLIRVYIIAVSTILVSIVIGASLYLAVIRYLPSNIHKRIMTHYYSEFAFYGMIVGLLAGSASGYLARRKFLKQEGVNTGIDTFDTSLAYTPDTKKEAKSVVKTDPFIRIKGQDHIVHQIKDTIQMVFNNTRFHPTRPWGVYMFLGPTGVGKTETAKAIAEKVFGSQNRMVRVDMAEYAQKEADWRLFGPPPGYIGSNEGGHLTGKVHEKQGKCVILLDEIEKAHPKVFDAFLTMCDEGYLNDASFGDKISFTNTIIIMTSNIMANKSEDLVDCSDEEIKNILATQMYQEQGRNGTPVFRREFLGRIDRIFVFNPLDRKILRGILIQELNKAVSTALSTTKSNRDKVILQNYKIADAEIDILLEQCGTVAYGARQVATTVREYLMRKLLGQRD